VYDPGETYTVVPLELFEARPIPFAIVKKGAPIDPLFESEPFFAT